MRNDHSTRDYKRFFLGTLQPRTTAKLSIPSELRELKIAYAALLEEHASLWSNLVMQQSSVTSNFEPELTESGDTAFQLVEHAIHNVLCFCREAIAEFEGEQPGSPSWNKSTGKILAYGRTTAILHRLQTHSAILPSADWAPGKRKSFGPKKMRAN